MKEISPEAVTKLEQGKIIWFASTHPDGRPHLAPVWFVWVEGKIYIGTDPNSVKVRNIHQNPNVVVTLEDGAHPVICEGTARHVSSPLPDLIRAAFMEKYEWDLATETQYHYVVMVTPLKWLIW